jgi:hypothetical protein
MVVTAPSSALVFRDTLADRINFPRLGPEPLHEPAGIGTLLRFQSHETPARSDTDRSIEKTR